MRKRAKYNSEVPLSTDRTFAGLRDYLIIAESNRPLAAPQPTAVSMGYAAATKSDSNDQILSLQAKVAALKLSIPAVPRRATPGHALPIAPSSRGPITSTTAGHMAPQLRLHHSENGP